MAAKESNGLPSVRALSTHDMHHGLSSDAKVEGFPAVPFLCLFHLAIATVGLLEMSQVTLLGKLKGRGYWWRQRNGRGGGDSGEPRIRFVCSVSEVAPLQAEFARI